MRRKRTYRKRRTYRKKQRGGQQQMRVLLTDSIFPNKFAKWRLVEIKSFMEKYNCDILVISRSNEISGVKLEFDYDILKDEFLLKDYDILIFNPSYNDINKYNDTIDGTKYNNLYKADYMLRHKRNRDSELEYNAVYHIFLDNYDRFNKMVSFPQEKQYIHLYPGGGYANEKSLESIQPAANIIATQEFISKHVRNNRKIDIYGAAFFNKGENIRRKVIKSTPLTVCFTSLGNPEEKGAHTYIDVVKMYKQKYPSANTKFVVVGVCPKDDSIDKYLDPMAQQELSQFYYDTVDVLLNLETGVQPNGFPLGIEAASQGCVLLTTDVHNQNALNKFNFDEFFIIDKSNTADIVERINNLNDSNFRRTKSTLLQDTLYKLFSYDNTMLKIFDFITNDTGRVKLKPV
jgi:hypothetical protein